MTVSRNAGKLAIKFFSLILCIILTTGISLSLLKQDVSADGTVTITSVESWPDGANINFKVSGYSSGTTVSFDINCGHSCEINGYNFGNGAGSCSKVDDQVISVSITGWGNDPNNQYQIQVVGTWSDDLTATISSVSSNEPTPTPTPKPTATPTPKPTPKPTETTAATQATTQATVAQTSAPAQTAADNSGGDAAPAAAAGGDAPAPSEATAATETTATETSETTDPTETAESDDTLTAGATQETVMSVVGEVKDGESYDQTVVLDETHEDGSPVVMGLNSTTQEQLSAEKSKKQMMTASFWIVLLILLAGASYARYRYLKEKKGYKGSEIALNFIPGTSDLIYAIGYHFNLPGKSKEAAPAQSSDTHSSFNTASAMKELKKMEAADAKAASKPSTPSVPHKRPKELSVNHAAAVAASKAAQEANKDKAAPAAPKAAPAATRPAATKPSVPSAPHKRPKELSVNHAAAVAAAKTAQEAPKAKETPAFVPASSAKTGSSLGSESAAAARERAEAAKEQLRMRAEARRSKIEEVKKEELQQRPPVKRPASLSVNRAAATAASTAEAATTAKENTARSEADVEPTNSPFKPLDRSAERAIYTTPGLRPRKSAEDHQKMAAGANQLGKGISAQRPEAPYAKGGKAPMWAAPGTGRFNPFKPAAEAEAEPAQKPSVDEKKTEETAAHTSIADQTTHRSAFFDRAEKARTSSPASENRGPALGDTTRPAGKGKAPHAPTMGMNLEGKSSSILNNGTAPTATKPLPGFKPIGGDK